MILKPRSFIFIALFHLAIGIGLLAESLLSGMIPWIYSPLVKKTHPGNITAFETKGMNDRQEIVHIPYSYSNPPQIAILNLDKEAASEAFPQTPLDPVNWAVTLNYLHKLGATNIYIRAPFAWDTQLDAIIPPILNQQFNNFNRVVLGRELTLSARGTEMPETWGQLTLKENQYSGDTSKIQPANKLYGDDSAGFVHHLTSPASIENDAFFETFPEGGNDSPPLFIRWGKHILPTSTLLGTVYSMGLDIGDIHAAFGHRLSIGKNLYLPIDETGRIKLHPNASHTILKPADIIILSENIAMKARQEEIEKKLKNSPVTLVWEPDSENAPLSREAVQTARTIGSIIAGITPQQAILTPKTSATVSWILLIDLTLIGLWGLRFAQKIRWLILCSGFLIIPVSVFYFYMTNNQWLPFISLIFAWLSLCSFSFFISPSTASPTSNTDPDKPPLPEMDIEPSVYHEPNEVPIPYAGGKKSKSKTKKQ